MTRKSWLWTLVALSATTAAAQYAVQGVLASGRPLSELPAWFWAADYVAWAVRALVEAAVIVYLFSTTPQSRAQRVALSVFEALLIALITFTVGPALRALGMGVSMRESVSSNVFAVWNFGLAAYTSLMIGATGYAYSVQPAESGAQLVDAAVLRRYEDANVALHTDVADLERQVAELQQVLAATQHLGELPTNELIRVVHGYLSENGGDPVAQSRLAEWFGVSRSRVSRAVKDAG